MFKSENIKIGVPDDIKIQDKWIYFTESAHFSIKNLQLIKSPPLEFTKYVDTVYEEEIEFLVVIRFTDPVKITLPVNRLNLVIKFYDFDYSQKLYPNPGVKQLTIVIDTNSLNSMVKFNYSQINLNFPITVEVNIEDMTENEQFINIQQ